MKMVFTMAIGIPLLEPFIQLDKDVLYKSCKSRRFFKPSNETLIQEALRRAAATPGMEAPRLKSKTMSDIIAWLKEHPPQAEEDDIKYLQYRILQLRESIQRVKSQNGAVGGGEGSSAKSTWRTDLPYLRLYESIFATEETRLAYLKRHAPKTRQELDGRNSDDRPLNSYEILAEKFNDPSFCPESVMVPWHEKFKTIYKLSLDDVEVDEITSEQVRERLTDANGKLTRIVANFRQSGNGDYGRRDDSDKSGMDYKSFTPSSFLGPYRPHLLYYWFQLDEHNMMSSSCGPIKEETGASSENCPSAHRRPKRTKTGSLGQGSQGNELAANLQQGIDNLVTLVHQSNETLTLSSKMTNEMLLQSNLLPLREQLRTKLMDTIRMDTSSLGEAAKKAHDSLIQQYHAELNDLQEQIQTSQKNVKAIQAAEANRTLPQQINGKRTELPLVITVDDTGWGSSESTD